MSEPIPIIGNLSANGQPHIVGLALSPPPREQFSSSHFVKGEREERTEVEVHESVQLVTLASSDEEEDGYGEEGEEEGDIDLSVEEMDRLEPIDEEQPTQLVMEQPVKRPSEASLGVELMTTISEEDHVDISEQEEERKGEEKLQTDRPKIGWHFSEERSEGKAEEKREEKAVEIVEEMEPKEDEKEKPTEEKQEKKHHEEKREEEMKEDEVPVPTSPTRKITKEEDEAVQELLKELDEGNSSPKMVVTQKMTVVEVHEVVEPETTLVDVVEQEEENVTQTVEIDNDVEACTSVQATIFEDNRVAIEPVSLVQAVHPAKAEEQLPVPAAAEVAFLEDNRVAETVTLVQAVQQKAAEQSAEAAILPAEEHAGTPPRPVEKQPSPERNGSPVVVKMRRKTSERSLTGQAESPPKEEEQRKKPIEVLLREEKTVEIFTERLEPPAEPIVEVKETTTTRVTTKLGTPPRPAMTAQQQNGNGAERVEEVELRRAVEELQAVQQQSTTPVSQPRWGHQNGGTLIVEKRTRTAQREEEVPMPMPSPQQNGHQQQDGQQTRTILIEQHTVRKLGAEKENARPAAQMQLQAQSHPASAQPIPSPSSNSTAAAPAGAHQLQQQNGGTMGGTFPRGPGARSPFGTLEPMGAEDWRLSPKTLSRIKRLKVVMEGSEKLGEAKEAGEVIHHHPVFVKDTSRFWYKPTISREEAINMLKNKPPGTFVVRDSNSFPGAFGLALKVAQPPAGVATTDGSELVRHFLIEPSTKGVRLKGCSNEPVFGTLAALVYQHSITPLALPCRLILPEYDPASSPEHINTSQALLERGAACNVSFLCSVDTESLTGPEAVRRSTAFAFELLQRRELRAVPVHFKVSSQGVTLTDNTRSLFFRRHYPVNSVTFAGIDPESRVFDNNHVSQLPPTYVRQAPVFGFVARKLPANGYNGSVENACHIFAELDPDQPASAVVRFITNVMMPAGRAQLQQIHQNANTH